MCRAVYFCLIYIFTPLFWWSYIDAIFFFWYILLLIPVCLELTFINRKEFTLLAFSVCSVNEWPNFETSRKRNTVEKQPESSQGGIYCIFTCCWKMMGNVMLFPCGKVCHRIGTWWKNSAYTLGKVWVPISQVFPIEQIWLHFPMLWEIDGETHAFSKWWNILQNGKLMGKKHPYYWESISTNFQGSPQYKGFCYIFSCYQKLTGEPMHFPYDEVYHRMGI